MVVRLEKRGILDRSEWRVDLLAKILRNYLAPYRGAVLFISILLLIQSIATLYLPNLNADIINYGVAKGNLGYIWKTGALMLGISAVVILASIWLAYLAAKVSMAFGRDLRQAIFVQVERFSARELNKFGAASLITRNTNDVQQVQMVLFMGLTMMLGAPITGVGAVIMALKTNVKLSGLMLVVVPLLGIFIFILLRQAIPLFRTMQVRIDKINLVLSEQIAGIRVIRAFVKTKQEEARFGEANTDLFNTTLKVTRTFAIMFPVVMLIMNGTSVAVIWFGGKLIDTGSMPIGNMSAFLSYVMQLLMSVMMAVMMSMMIPRAAASAERITEVMSTESSVADAPKPIQIAGDGLVEFKDVEFRYPGAEHPVLSGINFTARPGQLTAIVGSTGSGKSTLLNLIPRLIDPTGGQVLIDGVDLKSAALENVWQQVGYVPQRALLFRGTIASNMRYGKEGATDEDLWQALEIAQAADFVHENEAGLLAPVAQGGTNFSGGQRQRLSIARAVAKKSKIYLLDDSFSALDYATDAKLRAALATAATDATLIVVAQRVSTILHADQIIVLNEGKIDGIGTHADLMETCQTYREIVLSQLSPEEAAS